MNIFWFTSRNLYRRSFNGIALVASGVVLGICLAPMVLGHAEPTGVLAAEVASAPTDIDALRASIEQVKSMLPDQSHAMADVGYHFSNLWYAADHENWPLADFYLSETRSHLKWAVRLLPVRHTKGGDVDLQGILDGVDGTLLAAVKTSVDKKDHTAFVDAYRQTIEGCYACHKAVEKPFLRPQIPDAPQAHILNPDPAADWPQ